MWQQGSIVINYFTLLVMMCLILSCQELVPPLDFSFFLISSNSHPVLNLQPEARLCAWHLGVRVLIYLSGVFIYFLMG